MVWTTLKALVVTVSKWPKLSNLPIKVLLGTKSKKRSRKQDYCIAALTLSDKDPQSTDQWLGEPSASGRDNTVHCPVCPLMDYLAYHIKAKKPSRQFPVLCRLHRPVGSPSHWSVGYGPLSGCCAGVIQSLEIGSEPRHGISCVQQQWTVINK